MNNKGNIASTCLQKTLQQGRFPIYCRGGKTPSQLRNMSGCIYYRAMTKYDKVRVGVAECRNGSIYIFCRSKQKYLSNMKSYCKNLGFFLEQTHDKLGKEIKTAFKFKVQNPNIDNLLEIQTNILEYFENL